jgi:hypothetical protein
MLLPLSLIPRGPSLVTHPPRPAIDTGGGPAVGTGGGRDLRLVLELEHARQRLAGAVVGAALGEAHALAVGDHGGEPGVA